MSKILRISILAIILIVAASNCFAFAHCGKCDKHASHNQVALGAKMSLAEFENLWKTEGKTPEGAVRCLLIAALETIKENNKDGKKMWGMVLPKNYVDGNGEPDSTQRLALDQFARTVKGTNFKGGIAASYLGGTPENGYTYSYNNKVTVDKSQGKVGEEEAKLFVRSGGKDNPSPVILKKNKEGYWKVFEYSSLLTGVKPIENKDF